MRFWNKAFAFTIVFFFNFFELKGQALKVGEKCPDVILNNVFNYDQKTIKLSDFKGKYLILDFWGTGCTACLRAFPKIDSLQKIFNDQIQFIAINKESYDSTTKFFTKRNHLKRPAIPFVTGDTVLSRLFPHVYVPHHVWIDSSFRVQHITDGYNATAEHIRQFVSGKELTLSTKQYESKYYFEDLLTAIQNGKGVENISAYSLLMHCISGVTFGNTATNSMSNGLPNRITQTCSSIGQLYVTAYSEGGKYDFSSENTVVFDLKDVAKYRYPQNTNEWDDWIAKYSFNYEIMVPPSEAKTLYHEMQKDLSRYFHIYGVVEPRSITCLALVKITESPNLASKGGQSKSNFWIMTNDTVRYLKNQPFDRLVTALAISAKAQGLAMPFIDLTNYNHKIDITLNRDVFDNFDLPNLRIELRRFGLDLKEVKGIRDVLVLKDD